MAFDYNAPTALAGTLSDGSVDLTWDASTPVSPAVSIINVTSGQYSGDPAFYAAYMTLTSIFNQPFPVDVGSADTDALFEQTVVFVGLLQDGSNSVLTVEVPVDSGVAQDFFDTVSFVDENGTTHTFATDDPTIHYANGDHTTWQWGLETVVLPGLPSTYMTVGDVYTFTFSRSGLPDPGYIVYRAGMPIGTTAVDVLAFTDSTPVSCSSTYTVAATLDGVTPDSGQSSSATVGVPAAVTIAPVSASLVVGATEQFTATTNGAAVSTWAVNGISGGNSTVGTITEGLYTAPIRIPNPNAVIVSATANCGAGNATADATVDVYRGGASKMGTQYATAALNSILVPSEDPYNPLLEE